MPKISVIIPCYNYANYLTDACKSVVGQSFKDFEIIIVNDGSKDNTTEVAKNIIDQYASVPIRLIEQQNRGVAAARNIGVKASRGEYILPLDADDMIEPEFLEETVKVLDENPDISIAYPNIKVIDGSGNFQRYIYNFEYDKKRLASVPFIMYSSLFRKKALEDIGGYKDICYEDWEITLTLMEAGYIGKLVRSCHILYRIHGNSLSSKCNQERMRHIHHIKKMHPALYCPAMLHSLGTWFMLLYIDAGYFLFKKTKLNNIEIYLRKNIINPIKGMLKR